MSEPLFGPLDYLPIMPVLHFVIRTIFEIHTATCPNNFILPLAPYQKIASRIITIPIPKSRIPMRPTLALFVNHRIGWCLGLMVIIIALTDRPSIFKVFVIKLRGPLVRPRWVAVYHIFDPWSRILVFYSN
jgi:hypothetical protein